MSEEGTLPATAVGAERQNPTSTVTEYLDESLRNARIPAASVTVVDQDGTVLDYTFGHDDIDTPFWLGSMSRSYAMRALCRTARATCS